MSIINYLILALVLTNRIDLTSVRRKRIHREPKPIQCSKCGSTNEEDFHADLRYIGRRRTICKNCHAQAAKQIPSYAVRGEAYREYQRNYRLANK